ncbi:hypothetical protein HMPREF0454_01441 [Hafnia alvei ATCC 51873]|uniref:Uncharacterized protein n=1 Tax=Hafnia alvei ATCC 51873 TaxID=1002364 RepID=G9Y4G0_HAFAL|nr:hypothetical protein HMPREF0454_01441 [Hafnia alvei ATCC 51873]
MQTLLHNRELISIGASRVPAKLKKESGRIKTTVRHILRKVQDMYDAR